MTAELEAVIEAAPDEVAGYLVLADHLQSTSDPRGELIALHAGNKDKAAAKLLDQHKTHFFGSMAELSDMLVPFEYDPLGAPTTWRWGFLEKLWISQKREHWQGRNPIRVADALGWMLDHPSSRFLRELTVGIVDYKDNSYEDVALVIARTPRPTLKKLILGDFYYEETELNWSHMGDVSPIYAATPNLESLTLRSGSMTVGEPVLPRLKELSIISAGLDRASFDAILTSHLPELERLNLQLGAALEFTVDDLALILDGTLFPKLKHLGLGNSPRGDELCAAIASSRIAPQLESLDMAKGTMGDAGAEALAAGKLANLKSIDVTSCYLTEAGLVQVGKLGTVIGGDDQHEDDDPDDRYISGRE